MAVRPWSVVRCPWQGNSLIRPGCQGGITQSREGRKEEPQIANGRKSGQAERVL